VKPAGLFPHPLLSALVAVVWLALQQSLSVPQLITAAVLGWGLPRLLQGFLGPGAQVRRWGGVPRLVALVLYDIVVANLAVARLVLSPAARPQPAWVWVPLDATDPAAVSLLAIVITMTPGTVSCVVDEARRGILVHALDCADPAAAAADMKARYERPLMEIFEP
jgi:multicomponent K+:H+ antiporter subunit E